MQQGGILSKQMSFFIGSFEPFSTDRLVSWRIKGTFRFCCRLQDFWSPIRCRLTFPGDTNAFSGDWVRREHIVSHEIFLLASLGVLRC